MDDAILITNGNMGGTAGDATLILRRAKAMYDQKQIFTHILLFKPIRQGNTNIGDYYYDISTFIRLKDLRNYIRKSDPKYVILYGDKIQIFTASIHSFIKKKHMRAKLIVDIQGIVEEKMEYSHSFFRKAVVYPLSLLNFRKAIINSDGAFVVSEEIRSRCESVRKNIKQNYVYYKVRCGTERVFEIDQILQWRKLFREKNNISDDTIVFCYSGYRSPWQKVYEIIEEFKKIDQVYDSCFFTFFCNTDEKFESLLKNTFRKNNYLVDLLSPEDYLQSLCGCDIGYILRDYNETNKVAFPNKFSDYLVSGMIVALNGALYEPMRVISNYKEHYIDIETETPDGIMKKAKERNCHYYSFLKESNNICIKELLYSSQIEASCID